MAITLRTDTKQDKYLEKFMQDNDFATKSKAILWLIENSTKLMDDRKDLETLFKILQKKKEADDMLSEMLSQD